MCDSGAPVDVRHRSDREVRGRLDAARVSRTLRRDDDGSVSGRAALLCSTRRRRGRCVGSANHVAVPPDVVGLVVPYCEPDVAYLG